jgi:hypothetical protein
MMKKLTIQVELEVDPMILSRHPFTSLSLGEKPPAPSKEQILQGIAKADPHVGFVCQALVLYWDCEWRHCSPSEEMLALKDHLVSELQRLLQDE